MVTIYALLDPNTEQIRYVGKTVHCPKRRLQNHLHEKGNTYKCNWIKSLNGKIPELLILDTVSKDDWIFWEQYWISQCKTWGFKLTNATLGGEGHCGYKPSIESTLKKSKSFINISALTDINPIIRANYLINSYHLLHFKFMQYTKK